VSPIHLLERLTHTHLKLSDNTQHIITNALAAAVSGCHPRHGQQHGAACALTHPASSMIWAGVWVHPEASAIAKKKTKNILQVVNCTAYSTMLYFREEPIRVLSINTRGLQHPKSVLVSCSHKKQGAVQCTTILHTHPRRHLCRSMSQPPPHARLRDHLSSRTPSSNWATALCSSDTVVQDGTLVGKQPH
jgi:hypothetical protein